MPKKGVEAEEEKREEGRRSYDSSVVIKKLLPTPLYNPLPEDVGLKPYPRWPE